MAFCWPTLLVHVLLFISSTHADDSSISLSGELTNFVPACAQTCFQSFLDDNFPTTICGSNPTLDCLCSNNSTSGFTVGEGAVQCIISEINVGFCTGSDASSAVVDDAYTMCNGQVDAIPNTHKTLTATLVVQTASPSIVLIAPAATGTSNSSSNSSIMTTTSSTTSSIMPTQTALLTASGSPSRTGSLTSAQAASETAQAKAATTSTPLSKPQVAGITVAAVGGAIALFGACFLMACLRRRRLQRRNSDILPFQADPGTPKTMKFQASRGPLDKKSNYATRKPSKNTPRVPPRLETSDPRMFSRRSIFPDMIGVAVSPENQKPPMEVKRSSRLLPEKPTLKLNANQRAVSPANGLKMPVRPYLPPYRQSTATEFEDDDDSSDTAVDETYGRGSSDRILDASVQTIRVIPPEGNPPVFVTNNNGNSWRPIQKDNNTFTTSPESYVAPLAVDRGIGSFSRPRPGPGESQNQSAQYEAPQSKFSQNQIPQIKVPAPTASQNQAFRPITGGSSVYSQTPGVPSTAHLSSDQFPPLPPLNTRSLSQFQNTSKNKKSYKQQGPYDRTSTGSVTSFDSEDSSPDREHQRHTIMTDLSPVVESPSSAGRSPVDYPPIPGRGRLSQQTIRMVPPPPQPDFASVFSSAAGSGRPPPQTNQNQNRAQPGGEGLKPWQQAELAAARQRRSQTTNQYPPPPQAQYQPPQPQRSQTQPQNQNQRPGQQQQPKLASPFKPQPAYRPPPREYIPPSVAPYYNPSLPPSQRIISNQFQTPPPAPPQPQQQAQPQYYPPPLSLPQTQTQAQAQTQNQTRPNPSLRDPSQTASFVSQNSQNSSSTLGNSSLLAKRLGAEKAAALQLPQKRTQEEQVKWKMLASKWRVLAEEEKVAARETGWKPQLAQYGGASHATGAGTSAPQGMGGGARSAGLAQNLSPQVHEQFAADNGDYGGFMSGEEGLPRTPGWVPRLTPTRRGDELFLSVA